MVATVSPLDLHLAQYAPQRGVERRLGGGHLEGLVGERHRRDVLFVDEQTGRVGDLGHLLDPDRLDMRRPGERQALGQRWITQRGAYLWQTGPSPAQVDPTRQHARPGELLEHELHAGLPHSDILANDLADLLLSFDLDALG